jgi:hypothetical protein
MVLAALVSGTELTVWHQQVDVVGSYIVLSHAYDGLG